MGSSKDKSMALKTQKARRMQAAEAAYVQSRGDAADYLAGRIVRVYDSFSTREQIDRREKYVREHLMLTPSEQSAVARGEMVNPYAVGISRRDTYRPATVHFQDGRTRVCYTREEAERTMRETCAVKFFDSSTGKYIKNRQRVTTYYLTVFSEDDRQGLAKLIHGLHLASFDCKGDGCHYFEISVTKSFYNKMLKEFHAM